MTEKTREYLGISMEKLNLFVIPDDIKRRKEELNEFLSGNAYMNSRIFAQNVLFSHEIQANNMIEGYQDDIGLIYNIIHEKLQINDDSRKKRILNLYKGYKFILEGKEINESNLGELYSILSEGLLEDIDINNMGKHYRKNDVFIYYSDRLDVPPDLGVDASLIKEYMDKLFEYINVPIANMDSTDIFIRSQIMHFYFCYIHPYYDINGRTSRTMSMWYLLNNGAYSYVIFNRAIQLSKNRYYKVIRDVKKFANASYFLNYMMDNVRIELEKEYIMESAAANTSSKLTSSDYQTMHYLLSMNSILSVKDFIAFYNRINEKKKCKEIYEEMILPLVDKGIIIPGRSTKSFIDDQTHNFVCQFNGSKINVDPAKIKHIRL